MNREQFLLLKLIEECAEVAQRASKQIQFGKDEVQAVHAPVSGGVSEAKSNSQRLKDEILDFVGIVVMLQTVGELPEWTYEEFEAASEAKKKKLQKFLNLSASLGRLPEIIL